MSGRPTSNPDDMAGNSGSPPPPSSSRNQGAVERNPVQGVPEGTEGGAEGPPEDLASTCGSPAEIRQATRRRLESTADLMPLDWDESDEDDTGVMLADLARLKSMRPEE